LWAAPASEEQDMCLHPQALQLLCACLEGLDHEADPTVRRRKLSLICRLFRAYGKAAVELVSDLGFADELRLLPSRVKPALSKEEVAVLKEVNYYFV
jgi:hypothetical protein